MHSVLLDPLRPPMWEILPAAKAGRGERVRLGERELVISEIEGISLVEDSRRPFEGLLLAGMLFVVLGGVLAYMIFEGGMHIRYLIGAVFLWFLGMCSVGEALREKMQYLFEMQIVLRNGDCVVFTSPDREDIETLALELTARRGRTT